jgi:hypothetical protein
VTSKKQVYFWYNEMKNGCMNIRAEPSSGKLSTRKRDDNFICSEQRVLADKCVKIQIIAQEARLPKLTVHEIVHEQLKQSEKCVQAQSQHSKQSCTRQHAWGCVCSW